MPYVVRVNSSSLGDWKGQYLDVAVLDVDVGVRPRSISTKQNGVNSIVSCRRGVHNNKAATQALELAVRACRLHNPPTDDVLIFAASSYAHLAICRVAKIVNCEAIIIEARDAFALTNNKVRAVKAALTGTALSF